MVYYKVLHQKRVSIFVCLGLCGLLVAGCATVPTGTEKFPYETASLHGVAYFSLVNMCDRDGVTWDYDPLSQEIILKKGHKEVKLLLGSDTALVDQVIQHLRGPAEMKDSVIYVPVEVRNYFVSPVVKTSMRPLTSGAFLRPIETVVIDAGHGGKDPGAIGRCGLKEKTVVLDVAERLSKDLEQRGLKVYLTRSEDEFIQLPSRPEIAQQKNADLFVSIHANATQSRRVEGFEVYYLTESVDDNARALAAAENTSLHMDDQFFPGVHTLLSLKAIIWDMIYTENRKESIELAQCIDQEVAKNMNLRLLGDKGAPFAVLKGAKMPAVLVEIGYISNREGERKLCDPEYRQKMADAIASGIMDFKNYSEGKS